MNILGAKGSKQCVGTSTDTMNARRFSIKPQPLLGVGDLENPIHNITDLDAAKIEAVEDPLFVQDMNADDEEDIRFMDAMFKEEALLGAPTLAGSRNNVGKGDERGEPRMFSGKRGLAPGNVFSLENNSSAVTAFTMFKKEPTNTTDTSPTENGNKLEEKYEFMRIFTSSTTPKPSNYFK